MSALLSVSTRAATVRAVTVTTRSLTTRAATSRSSAAVAVTAQHQRGSSSSRSFLRRTTSLSSSPSPSASPGGGGRWQSLRPSSRAVVAAGVAAAAGGGFMGGLFNMGSDGRGGWIPGMYSSAKAAGATASLNGVMFSDAADTPSWEQLALRVAELRAQHGLPVDPDLENGPANPHALVRRFGTTEEPRVMFYRDHAAWCPYCEKIWMQLEEKRIPYRVEKINMRCYGDKKKSFTDKVPQGMLPVMEIDGKLLTESAAIAAALEEKFPNHTPLLPPRGTPERLRADSLMKLERNLFGMWMQWLTSGWGEGQNRSGFEDALDAVEGQLASAPGGGPYFMGDKLGLVDITFTPFLERMASSLAYYKGFKMEGNGGRWKKVDAWYAAMSTRETYKHIKSDYYTHAHDLPPQLGGCEANGDAEQVALMSEIDGTVQGRKDTVGSSWRLPLPPLNALSPEPIWHPESPDADRLEAAAKLVSNHVNIARFAARGCGEKGNRPVSAPLADPTAKPGEAHVPAVDAALRRVAHELLEGSAVASAAGGGGSTLSGGAGAAFAAEPTAASLAYLRDRVGVPRDMHYPAARQLRAHLNWFIDGLQPAAAGGARK